ncbi:MAG: TIGR02452 family protein, partial [Chloroflexi bacterium]|nr:TIGR02452 family protein [Chloroflexota bacterium]
MEFRPKAATLAPFIDTLKVGDGMGHLNLTLVPLRGEAPGRLDYTLAADAIAAGVLTVTEVSEGGSVPHLAVANEATKMVLFLDGEELVGAKQNRILNTSVLVAPKSRTKIPVSCVEQGRWRYASPDFQAGGHSPSGLRARKSRDVGRTLRATGRAVSDQGAVWDEVAAVHAALGSHSPTMAMHEAIDQCRDSLDGYLKALPYPQGARGVCVSISGAFAAIDLFDRPETLERIWSRLMTGYALDALVALNRKDLPPAPRGVLHVLE